MTNTIVPTRRYLSGPLVCEKFSRAKPWLYRILNSDPTFPRGIKFGTGHPVWDDAALDAWFATQAGYAPTETPRKRGHPSGSRNVIRPAV